MQITHEQVGDWYDYLKQVNQENWFKELSDRVEQAYIKQNPAVYPPKEDLFYALRLTSPKILKCIIIGQDPYHEYGQAHGLSFSVPKGVKIPPSLRNIYKELNDDLGYPIPSHGCLVDWAKEGVLLLNDVLTVYDGQPDSHRDWGWQFFTTEILKAIESLEQPIAYILWGKHAQQKLYVIHPERSKFPRLVIKSNHPSPLSAYRGFWGSKPFSQVNQFLLNNKVSAINWGISE